jgi:ATP-dependent exoDNAse (exonuclease V) beta subunit
MTGDSQMLLSDEQARDQALDVARSFIVQAPAGSGKTELLIQRFLRLLATVSEPEEVIAITFTRKAAAEMQHRVLEALRRAGRKELPEQAHEQRTIQLADDALKRDAAHGWELLVNPRRLRIQTLDALNASIARSRPLSAPGNASGVRVVTDAELESLYRAAAIETLDYITLDGVLHDAATHVLTHLDNNTGIYVDYLARMLTTRDQWLPFTGSGELTADEAQKLRQVLEGHLESAVREHLELVESLLPPATRPELAALLDFAASNLREEGVHDSPVCRLHGATALPDPVPGNAGSWNGVAELLLTQAGTFRKQVDKRVGFPADRKAEKATMKALLGEFAEHEQLAEALHGVRQLPPTRYSDEQWQVLLALFRLLPLASGELKRLFAEQGVADHVDVAMTAGEALGTAENPGDVALLLDYQVKHLLIDEMQDTSSAQYRMLESLTAGWEPGDGRTMYCVGDPMQSIYRFRNAEVGQFLLARRHGIGDIRLEPLVLRRNFRSGERLVDWFNAVFPDVFAERDDPASGAVRYAEAVSVPQQAGAGACVVHPVFGGDKELEAQTGCRVIAETLDANPDDQMAVLVRGRNQLPALLGELRRHGISYRAVEIDKLTDLPEVIEVLALTRAASHPADRAAWLGLLRAPWIGLDWTDLHALVADARYATVPELLRSADRLGALSGAGRAAVERAMPVLDALVRPRRSQSLRDLVEACWLALGGPALLADEYAVENVYRYLDVLARLERHGSLDDVAALESMLDLERVSSNAQARLHVMTMHKAKGLEFEHVLLFGLGRLPGSGKRSVLSWFDSPDEHGVERKVISPVGARIEVENDPVHRYIEQTESAKDRHEQARLLYVACTRARKSLHLVGHTAATGDGFKPPAKNSLLRMLWPAVESEFDKAFDAATIGDSTDGDGFARPALRRFEVPWQPPAAKLLPQGAAETSATEPASEAVEFYWVGTEARIAGSVVHRWLQAITEGWIAGDPDDPRLRAELTDRWLRELGIGDEMRDAIALRVSQALDGVRSDPRGRWALEGEGYAELALAGVLDGKVESVVLDRVRIDDSGEHWIIDYKTSTHEGGNLDGFLDAEVNRYAPQLRKYAAIYGAFSGTEPRCALYFPLLQRFVEVQ